MSVIERKMDIDYIVQNLSEIKGFINGLRYAAADKDQARELYELAAKVRISMQKAIDIWQEYDLEGYNTYEALVKKLEKE